MKRIVLVGGCFDVLHFGHIVFLEKAKQEGDILIIALESDEFIKNKKHRVPVHTQAQRARILEAIRWVDIVLLLPLMYGDQDYCSLVKQIRPKIVAVTTGDPQLIHKEQQVAIVGGIVKQVTEPVSNLSTQSIITYETTSRS